MFTNIKLAAAVAAVGLMSMLGPAVAHSEPPRIPPGNNDTCANFAGINLAGINYVEDPANSNAYYVCLNGVTQRHLDCPSGGQPAMDPTTPCIRALPGQLPQGNHHTLP
jgi:hypothetical protein